MPAFRNIRLCSKDCLCLYVCPTGATDTENSVIDASKCIEGCRKCVDACPSSAIYLVPTEYPEQQTKDKEMAEALRVMAKRKLEQESIIQYVIDNTENEDAIQFGKAIAKANRIMAEDLVREAGYMLPQSAEVRKLLEKMMNNPTKDLPIDKIESLLEKLKKAK
jgi:Fe-S-cluster-containing hydrogenase component 2